MRFVGIDPSTKTGFVALDEQGNTLRAKELTGVGSKDPKRMATLVGDIMAHLQPGDIVCIEGFAYGAQGQGVAFQYGLGYAIRLAMYHRKIEFIEVTPAQLKKFCTGKGNAKKENMILPIHKHWGFEHNSDNVRDAYVLAQIGRMLNASHTHIPFTTYQSEVLKAIINPPSKKKKVKK